MNETYKPIIGTNGEHEVSNKGTIRRVIDGKVFKPYDNRGYLRIKLSLSDGTVIHRLVHTMVAEAFIGEKPFKGAQVNHKDLNRKNNNVENLEWVSCKDNVKHAIENRVDRIDCLRKNMSDVGKKYNHLGVEASKKPVCQIDVNTGNVIAIFESGREAAERTDSSYRHISSVCNGKRKTHNGFKWAFVNRKV